MRIVTLEFLGKKTVGEMLQGAQNGIEGAYKPSDTGKCRDRFHQAVLSFIHSSLIALMHTLGVSRKMEEEVLW